MISSPEKVECYKQHFPNGYTLVWMTGPVDIGAWLAPVQGPPTTLKGSAERIQERLDNQFRQALAAFVEQSTGN
jgi:hypothetical protein